MIQVITTKPKTHPPISTDFKSLNRIELSQFIQVLFNFYWLWGVPLRGWVVGGWGWGWVGVTPTHMCTHMHMHACACTCAHTHKHVKHDKHRCLHGGGHLQFSNMLILAFHMCMWAHMCVHVWGHQHAPDAPTPICPVPQSCKEPKSLTVNKSWPNWDNSILFENSLPLNTPKLI